MKKKILVTGSAGFIGFHLTKRLIDQDYNVVGLDIINDYYAVSLKNARLKKHGIDAQKIKNELITKSSLFNNYQFIKADLANHDFIVKFMVEQNFDYVINLAAQAGVRYSIDNPRAYTHSNIDGFLSILEGSRYSKVKHLIYASTSSVYGLNSKMPLSENNTSEHPMALYAATKKANEMMAHSYSHLYNLPTTGLRFFTVYGPWGRPDMAIFLFTDAILKGKPINVFNHGNMIRDFTYIDDIIESISKLLNKEPVSDKKWDSKKPKISSSSAPYRIFNIGNSNPVKLMKYIKCIEKALKIKANYNMMEIQPGDVIATHSDSTSLEKYLDYIPTTKIETGIKNFVNWYKSFY